VENWPKDEAIREMTKGGYGFHPVWDHLIEYIEQLDVAKMKEEIGLLP
jgi:tyrosine-protein phosphatase SIW14